MTISSPRLACAEDNVVEKLICVPADVPVGTDIVPDVAMFVTEENVSAVDVGLLIAMV